MRRIVFIFSIAFFIFACSSQKVTVKENNSSTATAFEDSTEYDVEMFDAKFEAWYKRYKNSGTERDQSYYESWNHQYVPVWNRKANSSVGKFPFDPVVGFNPGFDYGFQLNHKLFHYFMYVENVLKIKIIPGGPDFVID